MVLKYIFHFDEFTWTPNLALQPFYEVNVPYEKRPLFLNWIDDNTVGQVYVWPGVVSPKPYQSNWGDMISPREERSYIVFADSRDQVRFSLEFVGAADNFCTQVFKNGFEAYHHRSR